MTALISDLVSNLKLMALAQLISLLPLSAIYPGNEDSNDKGSKDRDDDEDSEPTILTSVYLEKMIIKYLSIYKKLLKLGVIIPQV